MPVNRHNRAAFVAACLDYRASEFKAQVAAVRSGVSEVITLGVLALFTAAEFTELVCGSADFDVGKLRAKARVEGFSNGALLVTWFWSVLERCVLHSKPTLPPSCFNVCFSHLCSQARTGACTYFLLRRDNLVTRGMFATYSTCGDEHDTN